MSASTEDIQSHRAQIEALEIGDSFCRAKRFDADTTLKNTPAEVIRGWRMAIQATTFRITQRTGNRYTIEGGEFRTQSRDIIACLVTTRTE